MKLQIYSDLHLEFARFDPAPSTADVVILAGDIDLKSRGVKWANEAFQCPVIYVCGNHEHYGGHIDHTLKKMKDVAMTHVHVFENEVLILDQTRFLVTTGWTDFSSTGDVVAAQMMSSEWMNDFRVIRAGESYRRLRPADLIERNRVAFEFLTRELAEPFNGKTVVITHHCPVPEVAGEKHDGHLNAAYSNRWHSLVPLANAWIFGHTHHAVDIDLGGCRLISNPRGYPRESTGFAPDFMIDT